MNDFLGLELPAHTNGIVPELWYVGAAFTTDYLLNDGSGVCNISLAGSDWQRKLYFTNEVEAHSATADYYEKHKEPYPYFTEWSVALNKMADECCVENINDIESQVMEFI